MSYKTKLNLVKIVIAVATIVLICLLVAPVFAQHGGGRPGSGNFGGSQFYAGGNHYGGNQFGGGGGYYGGNRYNGDRSSFGISIGTGNGFYGNGLSLGYNNGFGGFNNGLGSTMDLVDSTMATHLFRITDTDTSLTATTTPQR